MPDNSLTAAQNAGIVTYTIKINGKIIDDSIETLSIEVTKAVNQIPTATLVFIDGDPAIEDFELSNQDLFLPGADIEISIGNDTRQAVIFKGIITAHSISISSHGSQLQIECKDAIFSTTLTRQCRNFAEMSDSQVIQKILSEYPINKEINSSNIVHQKLTQYDVSDWDFILNRADVNGMIGVADDGKFSVQPPGVSQSPILTLTYGDSIL
ncbi:MAG: phage late control D family protein, partial [Saprospiraceae bacterium]